MHKKSIEASKKIREEEGKINHTDPQNKEKDEFRSESIAALRAKAQEHSARMLEALNRNGKHNFADDSSNSSFDSSFFSDAGETSAELARN